MPDRWVPASSMKQISRDESSWRDLYDDSAHYYSEAE